MFNKVTADILRMLPPVKGVDIERMPQLLSKVYAHIVGLNWLLRWNFILSLVSLKKSRMP